MELFSRSHPSLPYGGAAAGAAILALGLAVYLQAPGRVEIQHAIDDRIDYDNGLACESFGFSPGAQRYDQCKAKLQQLERESVLLTTDALD